MLHFILTLSRGEQILKRKALYILYLPALIIIFVYSLINSTVEREFSLLLTDFGWISVPVPGFWDSFFNIYYLSYSGASIVSIFSWSFKSVGKDRNQAIGLGSAFLGAIILGTVLEIILNRYIGPAE